MKIALLEAHDPDRSGRLFMPMGIAYLAAFLEREEPGCEVYVRESMEEALELEPDLVGVSSVTPNFPHATDQARRVRQELGVPVILGGPHITGLPHSLPGEFVAGALGEGEEILLDLVRLYRQRRAFPAEELAAMKGIVFHGPDGPTVTGGRPSIRPLDRIPYPKRDWPGFSPIGLWSFTSRGCPYRCRFCSTAEFWENYRMHSARYVIDELNHLIDTFDVEFHLLMDDLFAVNMKRLEEICELADTELRRPMQLTVTIRADLVEERMCTLLQRLGVVYCHLGLESASDRVLHFLKNKSTTAATNQAALDMLAGYGIEAIGSFIIGAPMEEEEDIEKTYRFIEGNLKSKKLSAFVFAPLVPFPGTAVWSQARERGLVDERDMDWKALDIDLRFFNPDDYILLSKLPRERFVEWFYRFRGLWEETSGIAPERYPAAS